eukprot:NODE_748_length_1371_cov_662.905446_g564_i0.p1 GENE.NODE_748_length_1371_cov_662.905446_g564_i0~~NODE_748_length_1371_cov_662.905446_g564_i0.p1  ORF type:complete len:389 (-),score=46.45 NODE_748_length_1371_cov_662.905446_g564_i0:150-1316(-)
MMVWRSALLLLLVVSCAGSVTFNNFPTPQCHETKYAGKPWQVYADLVVERAIHVLEINKQATNQLAASLEFETAPTGAKMHQWCHSLFTTSFQGHDTPVALAWASNHAGETEGCFWDTERQRVGLYITEDCDRPAPFDACVMAPMTAKADGSAPAETNFDKPDDLHYEEFVNLVASGHYRPALQPWVRMRINHHSIWAGSTYGMVADVPVNSWGWQPPWVGGPTSTFSKFERHQPFARLVYGRSVHLKSTGIYQGVAVGHMDLKYIFTPNGYQKKALLMSSSSLLSPTPSPIASNYDLNLANCSANFNAEGAYEPPEPSVAVPHCRLFDWEKSISSDSFLKRIDDIANANGGWGNLGMPDIETEDVVFKRLPLERSMNDFRLTVVVQK